MTETSDRENRRRAAIDRAIAAYKEAAEENGKLLLEQHKEWKDRGSGRGAVSPLGGLAKPAAQGQPKPPAPQQPTRKDWW